MTDACDRAYSVGTVNRDHGISFFVGWCFVAFLWTIWRPEDIVRSFFQQTIGPIGQSFFCDGPSPFSSAHFYNIFVYVNIK